VSDSKTETTDLKTADVQDVGVIKAPAKSPALNLFGGMLRAFVSEGDIRMMTSDPQIAEFIIKLRNEG
jgi:hypothetical protein